MQVARPCEVFNHLVFFCAATYILNRPWSTLAALYFCTAGMTTASHWGRGPLGIGAGTGAPLCQAVTWDHLEKEDFTKSNDGSFT